MATKDSPEGTAKPEGLTEISLDDESGTVGPEPRGAAPPSDATPSTPTKSTPSKPHPTKPTEQAGSTNETQPGSEENVDGLGSKTVNADQTPQDPVTPAKDTPKQSVEPANSESNAESVTEPSGDPSEASPRSERSIRTNAAVSSRDGIAPLSSSTTNSSTSSLRGLSAANTPVSASASGVSSRQRRSTSIRRSRNASIALAHSTVNGAESRPAKMFIQNAFEKIKASREVKRIPALQTATNRVLEKFAQAPDQLPAPKLVLEPLRIICVPPGSSNELKEVAIDTMCQLFSLNYLGIVEDDAEQNSLLAQAVNIVSDAWEAEGAEQRVELQIIKALTAAVANEDILVHGSVLMRAVRQVYHIFVVTRSQANQSLAQVSLTQMVQAVFERVKTRCIHHHHSTTPSTAQSRRHSRSASTVNASSVSVGSSSAASADGIADIGQTGEALTLKEMQDAPLPEIEDPDAARTELENITQDAGLLLRTLCRLSMKVIDENDVKSQPMRSKLLSLHLLHMILKHHISVFRSKRVHVRKSKTETEPLVFAVKPYLRQAMAQNALSPVPAAFEITAEIFWLILANLRSEFKPELAVFFTEVYFTAMDMRTATMHQKLYFMTLLSRICTDPRLLVELYLNYDCDPAAPNVFERLMELVSRMALRTAVEPAHPITRLSIDRQQIRVYDLNAPPAVAISHLVAAAAAQQSAGSGPASLLYSSSSSSAAQQQQLEAEQFQLKTAALEAMVNVLRSLVLWSQRSDDSDDTHSNGNGTATNATSNNNTNGPQNNNNNANGASTGTNSNKSGSNTNLAGIERDNESTASSLASEADDPDQFASRKQSKRVLDAAIQEFNFSPSRGLKKFVDAGLLADASDPVAVAKLLLKTDGLDKVQLGEFLGKNQEFNQRVMYEFVYAMDFKGLSFVAALRHCLQQFRLPGEGQVIDRYMQTFAKKYFEDNSDENGVHPDFASADAAWVLAMSVMMLNTDLHATALRRRRMTDEQFIRNNKGMNDGVDFRAELLVDIYHEIQQNEIKLDSEQAEVAIKDETYEVASDAITTRATQFFQTAPSLEFTDYYNASHAAHIRPMFELSWLAVLAGISNPFSQLHDTLGLNACLEGLELALRIACHFDVELARVSFIQTLVQATLLNHPDHMAWKNIGATHALFRVALTEGDSLRDSWYDMLLMVSQLERVQLMARERYNSPTNNASQQQQQLQQLQQIQQQSAASSSSGSAIVAAAQAAAAATAVAVANLPKEIADALLSRELVVDIDRVFANTQNMTNEGAVYFVKALSRVSLEEIEQQPPRLFALQKMVDVCYYNSARIRMGWSELWDAAMAEQFAKVLVHKDREVVMFALDSLRQLSMRFLEIDEMPHFAFQQEFLEPFSLALRHNRNTGIRVFVLECLQQMVMTRSDKLKSGWDAIFETVRAAVSAPDASPQVIDAAYNLLAAVPTTSTTTTSGDGTTTTTTTKTGASVPPGYLEACSAVAEQPEAKTALKAVELIHRLVAAHPDDMPLWQRLFVHFSQIAMQGKDLEVRGRCLEVLFRLLNEHGNRFQRSDWDEVFTRSLGPLFSVLHGQTGRRPRSSRRSTRRSPQHSPLQSRSSSPVRSHQHQQQQSSERRNSAMLASPEKFNPATNNDPRTPQKTPQRRHVALSPSHLDVPEISLRPDDDDDDVSSPGSPMGYHHSNDSGSMADVSRTLTRSPSPSRQRQREEMSLWLSSTLIQALKSLVQLFATYFDMLEHALDPFFLELLRTCILQENDPVSRMGNSCLQQLVTDSADRFTEHHWTLIVSKIVQLFKDTTASLLLDRSVLTTPAVDAAEVFRSMTARTMQALLIIGSVRELLVGSRVVFDNMPVTQMLRITTRLRMSYNFAREFNRQSDLRHELYQHGFFRQTPNLLHQESQAAQTYISVSMRLFKASDRFVSDPSAKQELSEELIPFCAQTMADYNRLKETEPRHIAKLLPIVESALRHMNEFEDADFKANMPTVYPQVVDLLNKGMTTKLRIEVQRTLQRVGTTWVHPPKA